MKIEITILESDVILNDSNLTLCWQGGTKKFYASKKGTFIIDWLRKYFDKKSDKIVEGNRGYNAKEEKFVPDMIKSGIIDPTKVIRNCIENAISVATMFAITDYAIITVEDALL